MNERICGGVVVDSTPQNNANNHNSYVHICTFNYLNGGAVYGFVR